MELFSKLEESFKMLVLSFFKDKFFMSAFLQLHVHIDPPTLCLLFFKVHVEMDE